MNREIREENKLYKRTALALHYLLTYKHLSAILEALKHLGEFVLMVSRIRLEMHFYLWVYEECYNTVFAETSFCCCEFLSLSFLLSEVVTRLSPLCCENMAQSGAVSKIFVLIRSCNRSVPCMEVIRYAVQVLLNVAKVVFHFNNELFIGQEIWPSKLSSCLLTTKTEIAQLEFIYVQES